ncbi:MAG: cupin domain-containing protein [Dissulfurispiraceae bacterium]
MEGLKAIDFPEAKWEPHPQLPGVDVAYLLSNQNDAVNITCALVHLQAGSAPAKHSHKNSDDILYVLTGKTKMWVEGYGDVPLDPGTFLRTPKGTLHQPHDIEEDSIAYDVWYPGIV